MQKKKLIVFFGKPGAGKTTIIQEKFANEKVIDVKTYVFAYRKDGTVPEEKTLDAYHDMYDYVRTLDDDTVILELGTNHAEYNIQQLKALQPSRRIILFLCNASDETLRERLQNSVSHEDMEKMYVRLERIFPDEHIELLETAGMYYVLLDMEQPWTDNVILISQRLRDL